LANHCRNAAQLAEQGLGTLDEVSDELVEGSEGFDEKDALSLPERYGEGPQKLGPRPDGPARQSRPRRNRNGEGGAKR